MYETGGGDHASVGMRKPSGEYELPIPATRLFWTKPGTIFFVIIKRQETLVVMNLILQFFEENLLQEWILGGNFSFR